MSPAKKPVRSARAKASRPDVAPLEEHLAALLNPALNAPKPGRPPNGFGEAPQAGFDTGEAITLDRKPRLPDPASRAPSGAAATAEVLKNLLESGDPRFKGKASEWVPHRPPRPDKSEGGIHFELVSEYEPKGDQPTAIKELVEGVSERGDRDQVLLGVTGSGKTFTMAQVIAATQRPALILAPNKTLAAQLYGEFKSFFPNNAVEYFVSYYDYYQPEAYVPRSDTYIEKESTINEQIDRMRHSATRSLLERDDVIIVASVSCIYGIGSVETYTAMTFSGEGRARRSTSASCSPISWRCNTSARPISPGALLGSGATPWNSSRPTTRIAAGASTSSATRSRASSSSTRSPARRPTTSIQRQGLRQFALRHAAPHPRAERQGHQGGVEAAGSTSFTTPAVCWKRSASNSAAPSISKCWRPPAPARASRTIHATSRGGGPESRRRRCSNTCPTTPSCSPTRATSRCRRSAACTAATFAARPRWPNTASACPPAWTTARSASRNGTPCGRRPCMSRPPPAPGRWSALRASSSSR